MTWDPSIPPVRSSANPIISYGEHAEYDAQIFDLSPIIDPRDSTKLIIYGTGMAFPVQYGVESIVLFRSTVANPEVTTYLGQVLVPTGPESDVRLAPVRPT